MTALSKWADTPTTKALLLDIVMEQPETRVGDASGFRVEEYRGRNALQLRRIFNDQLEGLSSAAADYWRATGRVNEALEDSITDLLRQERPDALIARLLSGAGEIAVDDEWRAAA